MKTTRMLTALAFILLLTVTLQAEQTTGQWKVIKEDNGITIENRILEGFKMKQIRATTTYDAPMEILYEVLDDSDNYINWFGDCVIQTVIKRNNKNEKICYHVVDVPWPLGDRDAVALVKTKADWKGGTVIYRIDSIRQPEDSKYGMDETTKKENRVRMPVMDGIFTLTRINPNKTKLVYMAIADPGIALPGWILNMFSTAQPYNSLNNLREQVKNPEFLERAGKRHGKTFKP